MGIDVWYPIFIPREIIFRVENDFWKKILKATQIQYQENNLKISRFVHCRTPDFLKIFKVSEKAN